MKSASLAALDLEGASAQISSKLKSTSANLDSITGEASALNQKLRNTEDISQNIKELNNKIDLADAMFSESTKKI